MKASPTPENIKQCTTQIDDNLYAEIKSMAGNMKSVKTYLLINKMLLIGAEQLAKERPELVKGDTGVFRSKYIRPLRKLLREKGL